MGKEVKKPTSADKKVQQIKKQQLAKEKEKAERIKKIKEQKVKKVKEERKRQLIEQEKLRKEHEKEEKRFVFCRCKNDIAEIFHKPIENIIEEIEKNE